jgi:branched-chain amino acid aminotransferase
LKLEVVERSIDRSELYVCDEVFFTGTAVEIAPVVEIDQRRVGTGEPGSVTQRIRAVFSEVVRGRVAAYRSWAWPVYGGAAIEKTA